ncbi:MAG: uroporphyrinogen decarboxylase family protein, partial [Promethearchaeota archaeon]
EEIDQWGCYWNRMENDLTMGHPGRPTIDIWDKVETWEGPNAADKKIYKTLNRLSKLFFRKYKIAIVHDIVFIQNRVSMLRGFTNLLIDHRRNPKQVHQLVKKVTDIFLSNVEMLVTKYKPNAVFAYDDLGTQQALFFSPDTFKKFYAGPYKRIINYCHDHDCAFHLHSCGNIGELIPTLIDIGVDSLEFDSPRLTGFEKLLEFRGKIPFWASVNIQSVYPNGTPEEVEQEVIKMIQTFSTQDGGYLAYFYPDTKVINVPKRNVKAFKRALKKWGKYPLKILS